MQAIKSAILAGTFSKITNSNCEPDILNAKKDAIKICRSSNCNIQFIQNNPPALPQECESENLTYKCNLRSSRWICQWEVAK